MKTSTHTRLPNFEHHISRQFKVAKDRNMNKNYQTLNKRSSQKIPGQKLYSSCVCKNCNCSTEATNQSENATLETMKNRPRNEAILDLKKKLKVSQQKSCKILQTKQSFTQKKTENKKSLAFTIQPELDKPRMQNK